MRARLVLFLTLAASVPGPFGFVAAAAAQAIPAGRLAVLQAESRGGTAARDLAAMRAGVGSGDPQTVRIAVRALGRLQKPALIADLTPALRHSIPEIRAEAANAIAQAAQGLKGDPKGGGSAAASARRCANRSPACPTRERRMLNVLKRRCSLRPRTRASPIGWGSRRASKRCCASTDRSAPPARLPSSI
jgi:HEAT repeat protein